MDRMLLALTLLLTIAPVSGQQAPVVPGRAKVVFVDYFTCAPGTGCNGVEMLRNGIMEYMKRNGRIELKEAGSVPALAVKKEEQKSGAFMKDKVAREQLVKRMGVQYAVTGHIRTLRITGKQEAGGGACYVGSLVFALKVKDLSEASVRFSRSYSYAGLTGRTPAEVIGQAIARMAPEMDAFAQENFKPEGLLVEVERNRKGDAEEVYVDLGFAQGVRCGQRLDVYAGLPVPHGNGGEMIGVLQVTEVLGDEIAVCKIKKGKKKIGKAFDLMQLVIPNRRSLFGRVVLR